MMIKGHNAFTPPLQQLPRSTKKLKTRYPKLQFFQNHSLTTPHVSNLIRLRANSVPGIPQLETDESELLLAVELNHTHTLPPALTLEHGLIKIKEEVQKWKSKRPCARSGILRFQVAVPPSAKAFSWLCTQPQLSGVFPQFFLSKMDVDNPIIETHCFDGRFRIFGVGSAVSSKLFISDALSEWRWIKRLPYFPVSVNTLLMCALLFHMNNILF
ncbi:hypothetical protein GIB67_007202 [Kingdonia uniflora]|uniref:Uncharacterized protein n=1 Tax=Kingdonia uniflora TaxID=39325 RepID=A0A7J7NWV1_9MAGN|nr:hypothetical protein GIB67_007202 [Kingdonia uniflora]